MTALPTAPCKLCGKPIVWAEGVLANGAPGRLPMDPRVPCYVVQSWGDGVKATRDTTTMPLHHVACGKVIHKNCKPAKPGDGDDLEKAQLRKEVQTLRDRVAVLTNMLRDASPAKP